MARPLRVEMAGGHYHVICRGIERRTVFRDLADHQKFVAVLGEVATVFGWRVHAWVLMGNHFHLLLQTTVANLSRSMQRLNQHYAAYFNHRYRRVGPLWQGRFKAIIVDWDDAGLEVSRYVHLNPVRLKALGLSRDQREERSRGPDQPLDVKLIRERLKGLREYPWSSWRVFSGQQARPAWLEVESSLEAFRHTGKRHRKLDDAQCLRAYVAWVEESVREDLPETYWERVRSGWWIGGTTFGQRVRKFLHGEPAAIRVEAERARRQARSLAAVVRLVEMERGQRLSEFIERRGDGGRDEILWLAREHTSLSLKQLAQWAGGLDPSAVSVAIARLKVKRQNDPKLNRRLDQWSKKLSVMSSVTV